MDTTRHIWSQPGIAHINPEWGRDRRPFYKRMLSKIPFGWVVLLVMAAAVAFNLWSSNKYRYRIKQGEVEYYTNFVRQSGGCIMFQDGYDKSDSTQICGHYTLIKQH